ncbi:MAG: peptidoglycan-binding protein, partial [Candidatus Niyogibacteria bacterium]|nr:peptidoglycan-binding protein [Candidatus Niyogibacteria bacterium]
KGMSHSDVKRLQQFLNSDPDTKITSSGIGSPGNETEYFGSLTEKAVQKFQEKHSLAKPGDVGYGFVGPKTRVKLEEIYSQGTTAPSASSAVPAGTSAQEAALKAQLDNLQKQLNEMLKKLNASQ